MNSSFMLSECPDCGEQFIKGALGEAHCSPTPAERQNEPSSGENMPRVVRTPVHD